MCVMCQMWDEFWKKLICLPLRLYVRGCSEHIEFNARSTLPNMGAKLRHCVELEIEEPPFNKTLNRKKNFRNNQWEMSQISSAEQMIYSVILYRQKNFLGVSLWNKH